MQLNNLFTDEDAVSPVIGVILMVAITVILAAVIGAFVLGIGGSQEKVPQASFSWEESGDTDVIVTHDGGDAIEADLLSFSPSDCDFDGANPFTAGETATCGGEQGNEVNLIWESAESDKSSILSTYDG